MPRQFFRNGDILEWPANGNISVSAGNSGQTGIFGSFYWNAGGASQPAVTISQREFPVADSLSEGHPRYYLRVAPATAPALSGTDNAYLEYRLSGDEGNRPFLGAYGIFTFWCKSSVAKEIVVNCIRDLGTGGSTASNAQIFEVGRQSFQLTTGWKKYEVKLRFDALAGATFGTDGSISLRIYLQAGSAILGGNGINWVAGTTDLAAFSFTRQSDSDFAVTRLSGDASSFLSDSDGVVTLTDSIYGADPTGVGDSTDAFTAALAAVPSGGVLYVPNGTYLIAPDTLSITKSNFRITGPGTLKCSASGTTLFSITGSNVWINDVTFDGDSKVMKLIYVGDYSTDWTIEGATFQNARVTDVNDTSNTGGSAANGNATSIGIHLHTGCSRFNFLRCAFTNISYDGIKAYHGGDGRVSRAILAAPFLAAGDHLAHSEADATTDIYVWKCRFVNNDADKAKIDNDAFCVQNINTQDVLNCRIQMIDCYVKNWGWRAGKFQCSGVTVDNNEVWSGTTLAAGVADTDTYLKCMSSAFFFVGNNVACLRNKIYGGSIEKPIAITSTDTWGRVKNFRVCNNEINLDPTGCANSYMINLESVYKGTVSDNIITCGYYGIYLRGLCEFVTGGNNVIGTTGNVGIVFGKETQVNTWQNLAPKNCSINGTVTESTGSFQVSVASECVNVNVYGTTGVGTGTVNYGSGATGERGLNTGASVGPVTWSTSNANYYMIWDVEASAPRWLTVTGPFANVIMTSGVVGGQNNISFGYLSGVTNIRGQVGLNTNFPDASAKLDVPSTTQGFLPPRMTKAQRNAISSPANGLTVYQTDNTPGLRVYENSAWVKYTATADP